LNLDPNRGKTWLSKENISRLGIYNETAIWENRSKALEEAAAGSSREGKIAEELNITPHALRDRGGWAGMTSAGYTSKARFLFALGKDIARTIESDQIISKELHETISGKGFDIPAGSAVLKIKDGLWAVNVRGTTCYISKGISRSAGTGPEYSFSGNLSALLTDAYTIKRGPPQRHSKQPAG